MSPRKIDEVVDGISIGPVPITRGDEVKIKYRGALTSAGAGKVYLHTGYGHQAWENIRDLPMRKGRDGWSANLSVDRGPALNFCFHDENGAWDNNAGRNWAYTIHDGG